MKDFPEILQDNKIFKIESYWILKFLKVLRSVSIGKHLNFLVVYNTIIVHFLLKFLPPLFEVLKLWPLLFVVLGISVVLECCMYAFWICWLFHNVLWTLNINLYSTWIFSLSSDSNKPLKAFPLIHSLKTYFQQCLFIVLILKFNDLDLPCH